MHQQERKTTFPTATDKKVRQQFKKEERLHEKKLIGILFNEGKSFFKFPFKVYHYELEQTASYPAKVLISVSKHNFKRAVDRNRIKRLVREAYRKNKHLLFTKEDGSEIRRKTRVIGLIYTGNALPKYDEVEKKIILILHELVKNEETAG